MINYLRNKHILHKWDKYSYKWVKYLVWYGQTNVQIEYSCRVCQICGYKKLRQTGNIRRYSND